MLSPCSPMNCFFIQLSVISAAHTQAILLNIFTEEKVKHGNLSQKLIAILFKMAKNVLLWEDSNCISYVLKWRAFNSIQIHFQLFLKFSGDFFLCPIHTLNYVHMYCLNSKYLRWESSYPLVISFQPNSD